MKIAAERLFDGFAWSEQQVITIAGDRIVAVEPDDATSSVELRAGVVLPGLVDCGAVATGYSERPLSDPFAPEHAFAAMSVRYGVTTIVDMGSALQSIAAPDAIAAGRRPRYVFCGGRLTDQPTLRTDLVVTESTTGPIVAALAAAGARFLALGCFLDNGVRDRVLAEAAAFGLPCAWSASSGARDTPGWIWSPQALSPSALGFHQAVPDCWVTPTVHHAARWTIDGLLEADEAHLAAPVLPYARNFRRSKGRVGRRIGRDVLSSLYGERPDHDLGTHRPHVAVDALTERRCLAASGAGNPGLVPGLSLWRELAGLAELTNPTDALYAATGAPSAAGLTPAGRVVVGGPADLLLLRPYDALAEIPNPSLIDHLVLRGETTSVDDLSAHVHNITQKALQEA